MTYDISALVINKNYQDDLDALQRELGWTLEQEEDVSFETASSNWKDDEVCDIYFSEKGTLVFISTERCSEALELKRANTLTFSHSETTLEYSLFYCERGVLEREILDIEYDRVTDEGERLDVEDISEDASEIIWNQLDAVLGESFWDIDPQEQCVRYRFVKGRNLQPDSFIANESPSNASSEDDKSDDKSAQWWKFW